MSLIEGRWLVMGSAAAAAVTVPVMLLDREPSRVAPSPEVRLTEIDASMPGGLSYALAAPPFDPDRSAGSAAPEDVVTAPPADSAPPPAPPVLVGIVSGGGRPSVALAKGADGKTEALAAGASMDAWRLVTIGRDLAVFEQGGVRHTARLDFSNKARREPATVSAEMPAPVEPSAPRREEAANGQQQFGNSL